VLTYVDSRRNANRRRVAMVLRGVTRRQLAIETIGISMVFASGSDLTNDSSEGDCVNGKRI